MATVLRFIYTNIHRCSENPENSLSSELAESLVITCKEIRFLQCRLPSRNPDLRSLHDFSRIRNYCSLSPLYGTLNRDLKGIELYFKSDGVKQHNSKISKLQLMFRG